MRRVGSRQLQRQVVGYTASTSLVNQCQRAQVGETINHARRQVWTGSAQPAVARYGSQTRIPPVRSTTHSYILIAPSILRTVTPTGDKAEGRERMKQEAPGPIGCVLDLLSASAGTAPVREYSRVVLMGGVIMLGGDDLALPYP